MCSQLGESQVYGLCNIDVIDSCRSLVNFGLYLESAPSIFILNDLRARKDNNWVIPCLSVYIVNICGRLHSNNLYWNPTLMHSINLSCEAPGHKLNCFSGMSIFFIKTPLVCSYEFSHRSFPDCPGGS